MATKKKSGKRIVKFRLITWFEEVPNLVDPNGEPVHNERINHIGEEVDIPAGIWLDRLDSLGSLYTVEESDAIRDGKYNGPDAAILYAAREGLGYASQAVVQPANGEHGDVSSMDAVQLADYITEQRLGIDATLSLVSEDADEDEINKFLDAENIASDNTPRKGIVDALEARLNAGTG